MDDRIAFEEAGRLGRYFLNWRHAALVGYLAFLFAVVLLVRHLWDNSAAVLAILVLAIPIGLMLALADLRSRRLSLAAIDAAKRIESGHKAHVYSSLARSSASRASDSSGAERWGLAPIYWGYSAALAVTTAVIAWNRFNTTTAELAPWVLVFGSLLAIAAAFVIGRSQYASALRRDAAAEQRSQENATRLCMEFGSNVIESISELQRGADFKNRDMVARQESRLRDLMLFAQLIGIREVKPEALPAFLALRGVASEAAADARSALDSWSTNSLSLRFDVLMKRANEANASLEAAMLDLVPAPLSERRTAQADDAKVLRRVTG